jgi:hypothetical protein
VELPVSPEKVMEEALPQLPPESVKILENGKRYSQ